ncbi:hypothetical protein NPX13_g4844 [Xylaria arbuscula]|uniref:Uncharacterized protein n=1 Tax=Xylaria arbuscula TaxID=114810 RepID=A0A9W8TN85_9PEZI|nr:hypothetical protein NPX13_g4844 [Xylaria arbuscula]
MPPQPIFSFTIPSVHDGTKLDCRLFYPSSLRDPSQPGPSWTGHVAIVAHPYAPLGGCFDDPIVDVIAGTLTLLGYMVATFNFRGAAPSTGRTSWTSRPEQADYVSVVGFLAYYAHHLYDSSPTTRCMSPQHLSTMLLAGYSYGALVMMNLPSLDAMLAYFATPAIHTAEADIRLRALHLAKAQSFYSISPGSPRRSQGVRFGGDEVSPERRRDGPVSDFHREERVRESVRHLLARAKLVYRKSIHWSSHDEADDELHQCLDKIEGDFKFQSAYLAVSPPVGLMAPISYIFPIQPPIALLGKKVQAHHR